MERAFCPEQLQNKCEFYEIMAQKYFIMQNAWPKKGSVCVCVWGEGDVACIDAALSCATATANGRESAASGDQEKQVDSNGN